MADEQPLSVTQHQTAASSPEGTRPSFFYDLGDAESYLAAERVLALLPVVPEWIPVLASGLPGAGDDAGAAAHADAGADAATDAPPEDADADRRAELEQVAAGRHVQPLRWPPAGPAGEVRPAMVAATYAKQIGRAVAFSLAAFRQAFAGGRDLADVDTVLIAAAACEMHPNAVLKALERASIGAALDAATADAAAAGVRSVPALLVGDVAYHGDAGLDEAAGALTAALAAPPR